MKRMPDNFIDCVVTSPPYWGLRDYGPYFFIWDDDPNCKHTKIKWESVFCVNCGAWQGCFGLEPTPDLYVEHAIQIFREIRRVLKPEGTVWLNLGDTYAAYSGDKYGKAQSFGLTRKNIGNAPPCKKSPDFKTSIFKPKDLIGIPWMVAFALRYDGWWLRQDIIWAKPNSMPESVTDRCTKAHEYIFLLTKSERYFYDADAIKETSIRPGKIQTLGGNKARNGNIEANDPRFRNGSEQWGRTITTSSTRNKRSVWEMAVKPFPENHLATFPIELPSFCILAGSPKGGIVYDPFMGAATTALAALKYSRQFIGSEINPEYCEIGNKRITPLLNQLQLAI